MSMAGLKGHKGLARLTAYHAGLGAFLFVFALSLATLNPYQVYAQDSKDLEKLRGELSAAEERKDKLEQEEARLAKELKSLSKRLVKAAKEVRENEIALTRIELEMQELNTQEAGYKAAFDKRRAQLSESLAALQKLSRQPPQLLLIRPASANETARTAGLLNAVLPEVRAQAQSLKEELDVLRAVRVELEDKQEEQRIQLASLNTSREELDMLRAQRARERNEVTADVREEAERIKKLVAEAKTLEELIEKLKEEKQKAASRPRPTIRPANPSGSIAAAKGKLPAPAIGPLLITFGEPTPQGKSQGIRILTRENTAIVSPFDGTIMYSGEFRSYGELLIIQHGEGYHSVLAGMDRLDGSVGQWVLSGEPIGGMGEAQDAFKQPKNPKGQPVLYVELQRGGKAVDPLPWLSAKMERAKP